MALGLALMFGVKLPVNFNSPYKSKSIVEFWRRWHITLSAFLRDYLYIPLGGNRLGGIMRYRNLFIVMLLGGLWHGAAWTFMVWGGLHGAYLCVNHAWDKKYGSDKPFNPMLATLLTFGAVTLAWVFFRAENFSSAFLVFESLVGMTSAGASVLPVSALYSYPIFLLAGFIVWAAPNAVEWLEAFKKQGVFDEDIETPSISGAGGVGVISNSTTVAIIGGLGLLTAFSIFTLLTSGPYEFIYFQF